MRTNSRFIVALALVSCFCGKPPDLFASDTILDRFLYRPHSIVAGASLGEWSNRWWQWAYSHRFSSNPLKDKIGQFAAVGQNEHPAVWFLAGSGDSGPIKRRCEVPAGIPLYFPIINFWAGGTLACDRSFELNRRIIHVMVKRVQKIYLQLDGESLKNPQNYYEESLEAYQMEEGAPKKGCCGGYWVMLKPLPEGEHILRFGGSTLGGFSQDIEYHLTVKKFNKTAH